MTMICPNCGFPYDGINPCCVACGRPFPIASASTTISIQSRPNNSRKKKGFKINIGLPGRLIRKPIIAILIIFGAISSFVDGLIPDTDYSDYEDDYSYSENGDYNDGYFDEYEDGSKEYLTLSESEETVIEIAITQYLSENKDNIADIMISDIKTYTSDSVMLGAEFYISFYENGTFNYGDATAEFEFNGNEPEVSSWMFVGNSNW